MGRKRILDDEKKKRLSLSLSIRNINKLKLIENYSSLVENLLTKYFFDVEKHKNND